MRCDANVSVRRKGSATLGTRAEIKNINSFRFVERAIDHEIERQIDLLESGGTVHQETRLYDPDRNETRSMRSKEEANDYRYFPDPDLLPVVVSDDDLSAWRQTLPELPAARLERFVSELGVSRSDAALLTSERELADFFETVSSTCGDARLACNWTCVELLGALNREGLSLAACPVSAADLGQLIVRIKDGTLSGKLAKTVFESMWSEGGSPDSIIDAQGLRQVTDTGAIAAIVDDVLSSNADQVAAYRSAPVEKRKKLIGFFVGQIMKASKGKANPQEVNRLLAAKLNEA
jgi:aspartyl-tRNA(Asn)/glutamyl-tRNA(Gln) amidotransferase subunit B